jgi:NAD(P)H-hydrate epimerase
LNNRGTRQRFSEADLSKQKVWFEDFIYHFAITEFGCIVDAVFGTGFHPPVRAPLGTILETLWTNIRRRLESTVCVSIDVPSGVDSDCSESGGYFFPDVSVTFTAPKIANVLPPASRWNGELVIANIGSPRMLIDATDSQFYLAEGIDIANWLRAAEFISASYKNKRGHLLMIAGSRDYSGAAVLCGNSAIRSGVGLVTLAVPESSRESVIARVSPEVMVRGISETAEGSAAAAAFGEVNEFLKNVDVIAIGSGLSSKETETRDFIRRIVEERKTPVVIDADGLTALSPFKIHGSAELPLILTPHEGEFMRLLGTDDKSAIQDRVAAVRDFAVKHNVILVLKGERALIGEPGGKVVVNPTGNSGLGKAGNGDTLTGIISGFAAQAVQMKIDMFETVVAAVYVAGMAGDIAEKKYGKRVMTASDVRDCLTEVFDSLAPR